MKVEYQDEMTREVKYGSLIQGATFDYYGQPWLKTDETDGDNDIVSVRLDTGYAIGLDYDEMVTPIEAKLVVQGKRPG